MLYFDNIIFNILVILVIIIIIAVLNRFLNKYYEKHFSLATSLNIEANVFALEYCNDSAIKEVTVIPTSTPREFDVVMVKRKTIFLNNVDYRNKSLLSIVYVLNLSSSFIYYQKKPKHYNTYYVLKPIVNILTAFSWGAIFIGYLFMLDTAILAGIITIILALFFQLYFSSYARHNYFATFQYLSKKLNQEELENVKKIHKYNHLSFLIDPILNCTRLFPFLLPKNQRFNRSNFRNYKENNNGTKK